MRIWEHQTDNLSGKTTDCIREGGTLTAEGLRILQELGKRLGKILHYQGLSVGEFSNLH